MILTWHKLFQGEQELKFKYIEEGKHEKFFLPYVWEIVIRNTLLQFNQNNVRIMIHEWGGHNQTYFPRWYFNCGYYKWNYFDVIARRVELKDRRWIVDERDDLGHLSISEPACGRALQVPFTLLPVHLSATKTTNKNSQTN